MNSDEENNYLLLVEIWHNNLSWSSLVKDSQYLSIFTNNILAAFEVNGYWQLFWASKWYLFVLGYDPCQYSVTQ